MTRRPHITDHALLRYLERVIGIDVEAHRREVENRVRRAVDLGACGLVKDGFRYRISDDRITTVVAAHSDPQHRLVIEKQDGGAA